MLCAHDSSGSDVSDSDSDSDSDGEPAHHALTSVGSGDRAPRPPSLLALGLLHRPVFPGMVQTLTVEDEATIAALNELSSPYVGLFLRRDHSPGKSTMPLNPEVIDSLDDVYGVGAMAQVQSASASFKRVDVVLTTHRRLQLTGVREPGPPMEAWVSHWPVEDVPLHDRSDNVKALSNEIIAQLRDVVKLNAFFKEHVQMFTQRVDMHNPYRLADLAAAFSTSEGHELQEVLAEPDLETRLQRSLVLVTKERKLSLLQQQIRKQVDEKISKKQHEYYLREQLQAIKEELGIEKDDKDAVLSKFRERLEACEAVPEHAMTVIEEEMAKLDSLEKNSSEFNVTRNYLDWLTSVPWGAFSEESFDVAHAKQVLDADHYGLKEVKERILEHVAVAGLVGAVQGKIFCFVGPPGVGKTSIGQSIAHALGREFFRFSVGGLGDVAEIKGHRRTYVGAMPGKLVQALKSTRTMNPVVLIDEVDKLGRSHQGDPASALLELLDPAQNSGFVDHYLDVPLDLSQVLFVCTANEEDTIPAPLRDRMEMVRLSGYDLPEKVAISQQYLEPRARESTGLAGREEDVGLSEDAHQALARWYCREAGVRNLEKHVERVYRKLALRLVSGEDPPTGAGGSWTVGEEQLSELLGKPPFTTDRLYAQPPVGVVMGLAWTAMGGSALYIETTTAGGKGGSLTSTGQMGSVMEESTRIAHTVARHVAAALAPSAPAPADFFAEHELHLHVPEGATPKDGPSAGITMITSLLSLALDQPVRGDLAMTGEVSLTGKVLPVGGIREKVIAARRSGANCVVMPAGCQRDFDELPDYLKDGLEVVFADTYVDVLEAAMPAVAEAAPAGALEGLRSNRSS